MQLRLYERNAFGRQVDSFITNLSVKALDEGQVRPFRAVFIRGPRLIGVDEDAGAEVLAWLDSDTAVAAKQGKWLVTSFHPELTGDSRFHRYFLDMVKDNVG